jgi:hypothetical protein
VTKRVNVSSSVTGSACSVSISTGGFKDRPWTWFLRSLSRWPRLNVLCLLASFLWYFQQLRLFHKKGGTLSGDECNSITQLAMSLVLWFASFMDWYKSHDVSETLYHSVVTYNANDKYILLKLFNLQHHHHHHHHYPPKHTLCRSMHLSNVQGWRRNLVIII